MRDDLEHSVPIELRSIFAQIVAAFVEGDFSLAQNSIELVEEVDEGTAQLIADSVAGYGDALVALNAATWDRSCYRYNGSNQWIALVDLSTTKEIVSDLTIHACFFLDPNLRIRIDSVHVP